MSLKDDSFPSSQAFDLIQSSLQSSEQSKKQALKSVNGIIAFTLKNQAGSQESWYVDLQQTGNVGKGDAPEGKKPAVTLILSDADFEKLVAGKAKAQNLFMQGKLKIKGNVMKATKMEPIFAGLRTQAKL